jgi:hypothetical protein
VEELVSTFNNLITPDGTARRGFQKRGLKMIINVEPVESSIVKTESTQYMRYGADNWDVLIGESWEPLHDSRAIEHDYQDFQEKSKREKT